MQIRSTTLNIGFKYCLSNFHADNTIQYVPQFVWDCENTTKLKLSSAGGSVPFICGPDEPGIYYSLLAVREFERVGAI